MAILSNNFSTDILFITIGSRIAAEACPFIMIDVVVPVATGGFGPGPGGIPPGTKALLGMAADTATIADP